MKKIKYSEDWPENWKISFFYDDQEIYGNIKNLGYCYGYWNRQKYIIEAVQSVLPEKSSIIDIGAAQGNFSLLLAEKGYNVTWNDYREDLVDYVKMKYEKGIIDYIPGNVFEFKDKKKFDAVLLTEVIEHVAHPDKLLLKITNLLKDGGYLILTTPNGEFFSNRLPKFSECKDPSVFESEQFKPNSDGHIFLLHLDELQKLAEQAGFEVIDYQYFNNSLTIGQCRTWHLLPFIPRFLVDYVEKFTSKIKILKFKKKVNSQLIIVLKNKY
jgi:2-polyprenyl-6-hydroxyphenyl methylase/3-demethylubiquinone-9 3-methyltransferase